MNPLPVILVTGFLGSGKTTLLRAWAAARPDLRMMFLVNDLSEAGVDAVRMRRDRPETHAVVGGSIFCECKAADFLRMLSEDVLPAHRQQPLDLLVVETSGIADPLAIGTLLDKSGHADVLPVRSILTVIAPGKFLRGAGRLPVLDAQVRAADVIVLNKTDTAPEETLLACEAKAAELNPHATLLRSAFARDIPLPAASRTLPLPQEPLGKCSALAYASVHIRPRLFPDANAVTETLNRLPDSILRIKGTVSTAHSTLEVDLTPDTRSITELPHATEPCGLDIIAEKQTSADLHTAADLLRSRPALIACDVFREELDARTALPEFSETVWLPMGLHDRPADLRRTVQAEIDRLEANPLITEILLLYALCGTGTAGLRSRRLPMLLPRAHDCIAFLLGSNRRHQELQSQCPGTYFYAPGWIRERRVPGPDRDTWLRQTYADRFDDDMIDDLLDADREAFEHYEKALFIQTPAAGSAEAYCRRCADHLGWRFESAQGDPGWMTRFLHGPHPASEFVCLLPGETVAPAADESVLRVVKAP